MSYDEGLPSNQPRRSAWCGAIDEIQRRALLGPATDSTDEVLDRLRDVRDLAVVELCVCSSPALEAAMLEVPQVKLVYLERVRPSRSDLVRPLRDVVRDLFLHARDYCLAVLPHALGLPHSVSEVRFLVVATGASSISMLRIEPLRVEV